MNKTVLSSLKTIANELDELKLISFADQIDDIIIQVAQTSDIEQQISDAEKSQQDLIKQTEDGEKRLKQDQATQTWRKSQGLAAVQNQIIQLKNQLKKQKEGIESEEENIDLQSTTPPNAFNTFTQPSNFINIV